MAEERTVNLRDYYRAGDLDWTPAFRRATAAAEAQGARLSVPPGHYDLSGGECRQIGPFKFDDDAQTVELAPGVYTLSQPVVFGVPAGTIEGVSYKPPISDDPD